MPPVTDPDRLGGRLPLLRRAQLDPSQAQVYDQLERTVVPEAAESGWTARLADGRFVGPFNALLRVPALAAGFGQWTGAIARSGLDDEVRQTVILTVGAAWSAAFEVDAHASAARAAGLPDEAVQALVAQEPVVPGLSPQAELARRFTTALVARRAVPDALYQEAVEAFDAAGLIALMSLIGQYQTISSFLVCFNVPVP